MLKAGFVSSAVHWRWERQFPSKRTVWGDVEFVFNGDMNACDVVFIHDGLQEQHCRRLKARRAVFVAGEPPSVKTYNHDFLGQFEIVLTTDRSCRHPDLRLGQLALPWHVGAWNETFELLDDPMGYDDFVDWSPDKKKLISVVSSNKAFTEGHRSRLAFVEHLKEHFGDEVDVFGRNIRDFGDKTEVLADYKYHVAIENSAYADYWTEKLSDPLLAGCYPIYHGCPNINAYFPENALTRIDIADAGAAVETIRRVLADDTAAKATPHLKAAKMKVLEDYNLFNVLSELAKDVCGRKPSNRRLASETFFRKYKSPAYRRFRRAVTYAQDLFNKRGYAR